MSVFMVVLPSSLRFVCHSCIRMASHMEQMGEEFKSLVFWRAVLAEFVGMALFLFMGLGATSAFTGVVASDLRIAFAFGIAIATFVHVTAHISGGHLNPAVTLGFFCEYSLLFVIHLYVINLSQSR